MVWTLNSTALRKTVSTLLQVQFLISRKTSCCSSVAYSSPVWALKASLHESSCSHDCDCIKMHLLGICLLLNKYNVHQQWCKLAPNPIGSLSGTLSKQQGKLLSLLGLLSFIQQTTWANLVTTIKMFQSLCCLNSLVYRKTFSYTKVSFA